jgi:hypothetical protein
MKKIVYGFIMAITAMMLVAGCENIAGGNPFAPATYKVETAGTILHGTVTIDPANAAEGTNVNIVVSPEDGYRLKAGSLTVTQTESGSAVDVSGSDNQWTFVMPASDVTVTAEFEIVPPEGTSLISIGALTNGSVSSNLTSAAVGTEVTLTVTPDEGYDYMADSLKVNNGAIDVSGTGNTFTFIMPAFDVTVTAEFEALSDGAYSVTIGTFDHGSVSGPTSATAGATVALTVTPHDGYQLQSITVTETSGHSQVTLGGSGTARTFTMPASSVTVAAEFTAKVYVITILTPANGSVTANPSGTATVGTLITLTAAPEDEYRLQSITVVDSDGNQVTLEGSGDTRTFAMPASNITVTAVFGQIGTYTVTIDTFVNGSVTSSATTRLTAGTTVILYSAPTPGYKVVMDSLTVTQTDGAGTVTVYKNGDTSWSFTMPAFDVTVGGTQFTPIDYTITIPSLSNGTITANVSEATVGTEVTLTASPDSGYEIKTVTVTKKSSGMVDVNGSGNAWTFTMPPDDVTVSAVFGQNETYAISIPLITNGTVDASHTFAAAGTEITLTVSPVAIQYRLKADSLIVTKAGGDTVDVSGSGNTWSFTMPAENVSVQAEFEVGLYSIMIDSNITNGTVKVSNTLEPAGSVVSLTIIPKVGCQYSEGSLTVTRTDTSAKVTVRNSSNGGMIFNMPASDVTVTAKFTGTPITVPGLYAAGDNTPKDLTGTTGTTVIAKALAWIKTSGTNNGGYTIVLGENEEEASAGGYIIGTNTSPSGNGSTGGKRNLTITLVGLTEGITVTKTKTAGPLFTVLGYISNDKPTLTLENITLVGYAANTSPLVIVSAAGSNKYGTLTMENGSTITGNKGGGVSILSDKGTFNMNGGTIKGNSAATGAAVLGVTGATFTKTGGTIYGKTGDSSNTVTGAGGHVIEVGDNWRDSTAGEDQNTADAKFWEN